MFDDGKRKTVLHLAVRDLTVEVDMTMILMMSYLERRTRDVSHQCGYKCQFTDPPKENAVETIRLPVAQAHLNAGENLNAENL